MRWECGAGRQLHPPRRDACSNQRAYRMTNFQRVKALMDEHRLTRQQVADLLGLNKQAVDSWFFSHKSRGYRQPSDQTIELLELKLRAMQLDPRSTTIAGQTAFLSDLRAQAQEE